ncbi:uracil-DNA glycosylase family protein [soil metagenome]
MADPIFDGLRQEIREHKSNKTMNAQGFSPLFLASTKSRVVIIGQAPGIRAQTSGVAWDDASGIRLMSWLGVNEKQFRDASLFALIPMDFYYPGRGKSGDLPPRKEFAPRWHNCLLKLMPEVELIVLVGQYAQKYYLPRKQHSSLTERVRSYQTYLPEYFPLVHPSPLNFRWFAKNKWFEEELVPVLRKTVAEIIT